MRNSKFTNNGQARDYVTHLHPIDVRTLHHAAITPTLYDDRFKFLNRFSAKSIEQCSRYTLYFKMSFCIVQSNSRLCLLTRSCDMFEFSVYALTCSFFANAQEKLTNIQDLIRPTTTSEDNSIYILHCSTSLENWLQNNDPFTHSYERKLNGSFK